MKHIFRMLLAFLPIIAICAVFVFLDPHNANAAANVTADLVCPPTIAQGSPDREAVKLLQTRLNELGFRDQNGKKLAVDGKFGPKTLFAVKNFQSLNAPPADGIVGPITWSALGECVFII
jgi:peptidoglycan hydrolase-like protein with peptidoglycan-binding domain